MSKLGVFCVIAPSPPPGESSPVHQPGEHSVRLSHYSQETLRKTEHMVHSFFSLIYSFHVVSFQLSYVPDAGVE